MSFADELHSRIFGFTPSKAGTAYERLTAVVLAGLGWKGVRHQTKIQSEGRRAEQRLDITATHPNGAVERLLVECKDWNREVGKATMDALVGVRGQAGFDAAMAVTTKGFTRGAVNVAVDEGIAMVRLREVRPDESFVMSIEVQSAPWGQTWSDVQILVSADTEFADAQPGHMSTGDHFLFMDGTPAETLEPVFQSKSIPWQEGVFEHEVRFDGGRLAPTEDGRRIPAVGLKWTETASKASPQRSVVKEEGKPFLVVEQLDDTGTPQQPRLVVDRHLNAWDIAEDGTVVERGPLS